MYFYDVIELAHYGLAAVLGLSVGSFLNVVIYRLPLKLPVSKGFSMCPECMARLQWYDLVPLFSWLLLRGRCRYCSAKISCRYPVVELLNALLYVLVWRLFGYFPAAAAIYGLFVSVLLAVIFIDGQHLIIPDQLSLALLILGVCLCCLPGLEDTSFIDHLAGFFVISIPLLLIALLSKGRAMGGGDIKLMAGAGLCLGWKLAVLAFILATFAGCFISVGIAAVTRRRIGGRIPFGPYLVLGLLCSLFFGREILDWYSLSLLRLSLQQP